MGAQSTKEEVIIAQAGGGSFSQTTHHISMVSLVLVCTIIFIALAFMGWKLCRNKITTSIVDRITGQGGAGNIPVNFPRQHPV